MLFSAQGYKAKGYFGFGMRVGSETNGWQNGFCGYPGVMLALVSSRLPFITAVS